MKSMRRYGVGLILTMCVFQVGCAELMSNSVESRERQKLIEREEELLQKVAELSAKETERIEALKTSAKESIEAGDLKKALSSLRNLHHRLHPCKGEPCTKQNTKEELLAEYMIEQGTSQEEDFVREQLGSVAQRAEQMNGEDRFAQVYPGVSAASYGFDAYPKQRDALLGIRDTTGAKWLEHLDARAAATSSDYPALSMLYVLKASKVAEEIGEGTKAKAYNDEYIKRIRALRTENRLSVHVVSASGELAESTARAMAARETPEMTVSMSAGARVSARLTLRSTSPKYSIGSRQSTGSFTYQEGTESKPNPELEELERRRKISQGNYDDCKKACVDDGLFCFHNMYNGTQYRKVGASACKVRDAALGEVQGLNAQIASTPKTIEEPAYKSRSYPVTIHTHSGSSTLSYSVEFTRDGASLDGSKSISDELIDEEHEAHSYKGGGVPASGREIPPKSSVFAELETGGANWMAAELDKANAAFLENLINTDASNKERRADAIILFNLLSKEGARESVLRELDTLTGVDDASELVR